MRKTIKDYKEFRKAKVQEQKELAFRIAGNLRTEREKSGKTVQDVALELEMTVPGVEKLEHKASGITVSRLLEFAELYNVKIDKLIK